MKNEQHQPSITFGYDSDLAPGRFVQVRSDFLCCPLFDALDKVLYMVLCNYAGQGARFWPGYTRLARECGAGADAIEGSLQALMSAGLVTAEQSGKGALPEYHIHGLPATFPGSFSREMLKNQYISVDNPHIPQAQPNKLDKKQIAHDTRLLTEQLGISREIAEGLAFLAAERGCSRGYVAEVVKYATTTPGIKNPAGCTVELIRRNETRRPGTPLPRQGFDQGLDPDKYTKGKYAFLFRRYSQDKVDGEVEGLGEAAERNSDNSNTATPFGPHRAQDGTGDRRSSGVEGHEGEGFDEGDSDQRQEKHEV